MNEAGKELKKLPDFLLFLFFFVSKRSYALFHPLTVFRETLYDFVVIVLLKVIVLVSSQEIV